MKIEQIYISDDHNYFGHHGKPAGSAPMIAVDHCELVAGRGIVGDRFFDYKEDYKGQVTFFSQETYHEMCDRFDVRDKDPSVFRRNILVSGIDLNALIGQEFELLGQKFSGSCEAKPCYWMDQAFHEGAEAALQGRGGLRAKVLTSGVLRVASSE